jgi:DNA-binding LytR/AlgR family response regulator
MIRTVIIEDEILARQVLKTMLQQIPEVDIVKELESVSQAVTWFSQNTVPDLLLVDVHLADRISFSIFEQIHIQCNVIFITAYDEYALRAFELQSIDYLLKPITLEALQAAINKLKRMTGIQNYYFLQKISEQFNKKMYKERFVVHIGAKIYTFLIQDIVCFYVFEKGTYLFTKQAKSYPIDYSLDAIENSINPSDFFRVNRQYIVSFASIREVIKMSNNAIQIDIEPCVGNKIMVSTHKAAAFKNWLEQ